MVARLDFMERRNFCREKDTLGEWPAARIFAKVSANEEQESKIYKECLQFKNRKINAHLQEG